MFDLETNKGKILAAAMKLAAAQKWTGVTLRDIAHEAELTMADIKAEASSKAHILALFTSAVDKEVLSKAGEVDPEQSSRDNLFETIMNRFDAIQPYKAAVKSILSDATPDPRLMPRLLSSQGWMLEASGISSYGPMGSIKAAGLASVYIQVARIWIDDDDPGMARTMAALDRRLRRGERSIQALDEGCRTLGRFKSALCCRKSRTKKADDEPDVETPSMQDVADGKNGTQPATP